MPYVRLAILPFAAALVATRCPSPVVRSSAAPTSPGVERIERETPAVNRRLALGRFGTTAPFTYYSGVADSVRLVVRDAASWRARWDAINRDMQPAPPPPAVDFAHDMIIVAALGRRSSGGWSIVVDSAVWRGDAVDVYVRTLAPGRGCFTTAAFSSPVDLARVPRHDAPVRFTEHRVRDDCD